MLILFDRGGRRVHSRLSFFLLSFPLLSPPFARFPALPLLPCGRMLSIEATPETPSACSERRLAANRANAQLSTGPTSPEGKAISSLNAVKTGLCARAVLLADAEEARAYQEHVARVFAWWGRTTWKNMPWCR